MRSIMSRTHPTQNSQGARNWHNDSKSSHIPHKIHRSRKLTAAKETRQYGEVNLQNTRHKTTLQQIWNITLHVWTPETPIKTRIMLHNLEHSVNKLDKQHNNPPSTEQNLDKFQPAAFWYITTTCDNLRQPTKTPPNIRKMPKIIPKHSCYKEHTVLQENRKYTTMSGDATSHQA